MKTFDTIVIGVVMLVQGFADLASPATSLS